MACKIQRDLNNNITGVLADSGFPSILFDAISSSRDLEDALLEYATTFTTEFSNAVQKNFANIDSKELYDENGEVKFEVYNKIMNPELTLLKDAGYGKVISTELKDFILQKVGYREVFQGTGAEVDDREINYFTLSEIEAADYGKVRKEIVNTDGFLDAKTNKSEYARLRTQYYKESGQYFDLLNNSKEGLEVQAGFFKFLKEKGFKGIDFTGYSDSKYVISFTRQDLKENKSSSKNLSNQYFDRVYKFRNNNSPTKKSKRNTEFDSKLRVALLDFIRGLNINVDEEADELLEQLNRNPLAAFDTLQKFLALRSNISDKELALQSANIIYTFIGKKSKLSIELWHNISKWSKYEKLYNYYYNKLLSNTSNQDDRYDSEYLLEVGPEYKGKGKKNSWAHRQVIIEFIAESIRIGADNDYFGEKRKNPDLDKDYFKNLGYKNKYEENTLKRLWNLLMNWINENFRGRKAVNTNYTEAQLQNLVLDIVDDVYKKDYTKFIRSYDRNENGDVVSLKNGEKYEIKDYFKTLESDPFAKSIIDTLFDAPFIDYKASGSLTLRKFGKLLRAISEDLHDIDGVITFKQFKSEANALQFKNWLQSEGLALLANYKTTKFRNKAEKFLNQQSWYINLKNLYPSWTLENVFIGRDHKQAESVTITGYVEHPTEMEIDNDTKKLRPKRYIIDFFLRTTDDALFPEQFEDNKWKYWKGIFEAKLNMGRAKDINDLIYFEPFIEDKYKFTNKGFRYFSFAEDNAVAQVEFNREQAIVKPGVEELYPQVNFYLKVVNALVDLSSPKETKRTRKYGEQTEPERLTIRLNTKEKPYLEDNLRKVLQGKGVTNQQIDFVFDYMKSNNIQEISTSELAAAIAGSYSYTIEINTATQDVKDAFGGVFARDYPNKKIGDSITVGGEDWVISGIKKETDPNDWGDNLPKIDAFVLSKKGKPTQYYSNLTVLGGTNYTENEIATPAITPNIKGHAQFATDKGIGWFRSDDLGTTESKTRRILEVQSDLFQKGRASDLLVNTLNKNRKDNIRILELNNISYDRELTKEEQDELKKLTEPNFNEKGNEFLQLLNKDNNWVTFFIKSIIQDSAKKGYQKILFPSGDTASKVEGHESVEEFKEDRKYRIRELKNKLKNIPEMGDSEIGEIYYSSDRGGGWFYNGKKVSIFRAEELLQKTNPDKKVAIYDLITGKEWIESEDSPFPPQYSELRIDGEKYTGYLEGNNVEFNYPNAPNPEYVKINNELNQFEKELERVEREGFAALRPIYNFYENTIANILKKRGYMPKKITDKYGNTWNEIIIKLDRDLQPIEFNKESEEFIEDNTLAYSTIRKIADRLSQSLGNIPYYIVDRSEAKKILEENGQAYNNEPAFFFNGQIYIVDNAFTLKNVVHEFSHPFIKALAKNNPSLFNKLYDELIKTEEGKQIKETVEQFYEEKEIDSEGFREEVLVRALTTRATSILNKQESSSAFKKLVDKILYNLKQLFRKIFGKVKIEKFNVNTTLEELAEMLTSDTFNISVKDYKNITAEFSRETAQESIKYLKDKRAIEITQSINDFFRLIRKNQSQIQKGISSDSSFWEVFTNTESEKPFQDIVRNLKPYQTIEQTKSTVDAALDYRQMQVQAFVENLFSYEEGLDKILDEINVIISEGKDAQFALNRYSYIKDILEASIKSFEEIKDGFTEQNIPVNSPIYQLVNELISKAENSVKIIKKEYQKILPDIIAPQLEGVNKVIIDSYNETIRLAEANGKSAEKIAELKKIRDSYLRDKNYITRILAGEEPEPSLLGLSAFVESAISSPDGLISSFAKMFKEAMIDVELNAINNFNDFRKEIDPFLDEAGVNFNNISSLGNLITRVQKKGYIDPSTNEFTTRDIVELLSPFKDYSEKLSKFSYDMTKAQQEGDEEAYANLKRDKDKFIRDYMHSDYLPVVYTADDVFSRTFTDSNGVVHEVGKIARSRRDIILERIKKADSIVVDELEKLEISSRLKRDSLWSEYYALYNKYMPDGQAKDEVEMAITEVLLDNRTERRKYFEWESDLESDSMPIKRFEKARNSFKSHLATRFSEGTPEYDQHLREWDIINTRKVIDKSFYEDKQKIILEIRELYDKINNSSNLSDEEKKIIAKQNEQLEKNLLLIVDQLYGYRDEENQPNGLLISEGKTAKIKEAQEEINKLQESLKAGKGLTKQERYRASILTEKLNDGSITPEEEEELEKLDLRSYGAKVPKAIRDQLKIKFEQLNELQSKYPTKYYLIAINYKIEQLNQKLKSAGQPESKFIPTLDVFNVDELTMNVPYMDSLMRKDSEFKKWFMANHILTIEWNQQASNYVEVYKRLPIWTEITPNDEKYFRRMTMSDGEVIYGMPTLNYYKQNIKPEFATPDVDENGIRTKDTRGRWLPRVIPNSPYVNQEYFDLERNNKPVFDLLQKITEQYFKFQEKADPSDRLGYELPRYERNKKELIETNAFISGKVSGIKAIYRNIINKLQENPEDFESGLSIEDKFRLVTLDQFDDDQGKIFISGKAMLDEDQVSRDVITSIIRHMFSIERAAKLREIHPMAKALVEVLEDPKNQPKDTTKGSWYDFVFKQGQRIFANKKGANTRAQAIKALVERNFYNVQQTGFGSDVTFLQKASRLMMAGASFGFFALDIVSAVKNRFGQQIQQAIELAAGTSYDAKSFLKGKIIASKAMMEISASIYSRGKLPFHVQLVNAFDPAQGRLAEKLPEMITRTIYKDAVSPLNATMSPRKFLELEATLEFFYGVMENTKVEQTVNGQTTMIPYHEAFELVDGVLKLKQGIDPKYDLGGSEFKKIRLFIQEKQNIVNGVFSLADQPEGNRYIFYRMFMFLRKFFVTQFLNRFGYSGSILNPRFRRNIATENIEMGYWLQFAKGVIKLLSTMGDHYHFMIPQERAAMRKALTEMAILVILSVLIPWMLGWDEDDEEKYAKLRERQGGPLGSDKFQFGGWLANHALYQTLSVAQENTQFYDLGFYSSMASNFNLANGPTLKTYGKILGDIKGIVTGDDSAYYEKDVGPYSWQKAESAKIYNHLGKAFALSGKNIDPAQATKDFISAENIY